MAEPIFVEFEGVDGGPVRVDAASKVRVMQQRSEAPSCLVISGEGSGYVRGTPEEVWARLDDAMADPEEVGDAIEEIERLVPNAAVNRPDRETVTVTLKKRGAALFWPGGSSPPAVIAMFLTTGEPEPGGPSWGGD